MNELTTLEKHLNLEPLLMDFHSFDYKSRSSTIRLKLLFQTK